MQGIILVFSIEAHIVNALWSNKILTPSLLQSQQLLKSQFVDVLGKGCELVLYLYRRERNDSIPHNLGVEIFHSLAYSICFESVFERWK